ncbi:sushi, von Willebrand factor type A, EGF and pentraxin domain-containing protein 1 [Eurytemora carolleeae]|uniref:sushi, von Willebrand factor type A, EGF and pentraxin domain-containing protein 1 n=1 Tax=Eurytemora carolleeae TaxID=1294199 RepID=UPI000C7618A8|nr:sushi, von Willebrand factor type A, EGF and pentraxin domain-containing protein 1 [Eurytemora carolleeae]|eukprot:XP_023320541.1 sushi, von Willebrand factor type A, EGF and pentraxin domain-containing protein 1-like [Eurytemora affinis]
MLNLFIFLLVVLGAQVSDQQSAHVRALQSRRNLHRENARNKVDMLGYLLKKHVSKLRSGDNYEADLVFLVDSSASVGADNFYNEIKFIRKLLADFTVSYNSTRVVIITYSSVNQVIRQVDHMSVPVTTKHKCSLFESEIPAITYNSGGTYTLGALLEAADVFRFSRDTAKKAVFLITDGYSNGGDPRPAAERLKQQGVEFYTFGIRNGNVKELFDMASEPRSEHSFILDSFEEFEALARRALHKDLGGSMYLKQDPRTCSQLCTGSDCCDPVAECSCGAHNGYYSCICPKGFFGRGLKGDCHKCPAGTYKPRLDPGDRRSCIPCPDENQISSPGSFSALQCHCKEGYEIRNGKCTMMDCPPLSPPLNGHFIRNECKNVFNAACGSKCNSGFNLVGSSIRLCLPTGEWSGEPAYCIAKTCRKLQPPTNGFITCSDRTNEVDTVCEFG